MSAQGGPWTSHGHAIDGVTVAGDGGPRSVARCGGPALCSKCATEAAQLRKQPTPDRTAREGLVEALAGALRARHVCGHEVLDHHLALDKCDAPMDDVLAEALAPTVAALMTEHAARVAGEAWEQGAYEVREWQRRFLAYHGPLGMGQEPLHPRNPYRAALRAGGEGEKVPSARSTGAQAAQEASEVAEGQEGHERPCSALWGSHGCDWLTQPGHTLHRCGTDDDPCSEYDEQRNRVRYWDDSVDNGLGGDWGPWWISGKGELAPEADA